jgi:hypothetical protein
MKEEPSLIFKVYILMKNPKTGKTMHALPCSVPVREVVVWATEVRKCLL